MHAKYFCHTVFAIKSLDAFMVLLVSLCYLFLFIIHFDVVLASFFLFFCLAFTTDRVIVAQHVQNGAGKCIKSNADGMLLGCMSADMVRLHRTPHSICSE